MDAIAILTGGGPAPGLNTVVGSVAKTFLQKGYRVLGLHGGYSALFTDTPKITEIDFLLADDIFNRGGSFLTMSRFKPSDKNFEEDFNLDLFVKNNVKLLVTVGGDDTASTANRIAKFLAAKKYPIANIHVPKTIDNDLSCTDWTFGFDTASNIAMEEIDRLHTTAESHERCFVVECMGRHTGWITLQAGVAANAHLVLIPEFPMSFDEIYDLVRSRYLRGERYTIIAVAEGFELTGEKLEELERDMFGNVLLLHRELARHLADRIEKAIRSDETLDKRREHFEARSVVLGHLQRGGAPSAFDRMLGTRMGVKAGDLVVSGEYGNMVSLRGTEIAVADLDRAVTERKKVGKELYDVATLFY